MVAAVPSPLLGVAGRTGSQGAGRLRQESAAVNKFAWQEAGGWGIQPGGFLDLLQTGPVVKCRQGRDVCCGG